MDAKLQRRVQRYGWDLASNDYDPLWQEQLAPARNWMLELAAIEPGQQVLDLACGTGLATLAAGAIVGPAGSVLGTDLSGQMIEVARQRAADQRASNVTFRRMDAETLNLPDATFDVVLCSLGLMYVPDAQRAVREWRRVLKPGGRVAIAVWGKRANCGWSPVFPIVEAEVDSDVCPLFFSLGEPNALVNLCEAAGFGDVRQRRVASALKYDDAETACDAAFIGGPVALAWSRFDDEVRVEARERYKQAIEPWRCDHGYRIPGEFVIVAGTNPTAPGA
ncbi:MAG TPA: methyltransferase domain-containing protein [Steroidobacteraceae bacterium]|jgi:ubiquinone/menaquinone biosynthesis C-methylase UbiE|nr:methyltransferase domain-containing protein [Steroidobacteraceae bacterium]